MTHSLIAFCIAIVAAPTAAAIFVLGLLDWWADRDHDHLED